MFIETIKTENFRLLKSQKIEFSKTFNIFYGKNAQGKTSVIEAVYFLATGKSFRTKKFTEQINFEKKKAIVFGKKDFEKYSVSIENEKKSFYINSKKQKYFEYIGNILAVSFCPEDIDLLTGSPEKRRRFFDYEISQINPEYLKKLLAFHKILKFRNALIKKNDVNNPIFEIYTDKFIELSIYIMEKRKEYTENLSKILNEKYCELFGKDKDIKIAYETTVLKTKEEMKKALELKLLQEQKQGFSAIGPQKDEYSFLILNQKVKAFASQGEKKSIIFSLKIAQGEYILEKKKESPIFLLDDISAYLDEVRKEKVTKYFKMKNIQCFITSTEKIDIDGKYFELINGEVFERE